MTILRVRRREFVAALGSAAVWPMVAHAPAAPTAFLLKPVPEIKFIGLPHEEAGHHPRGALKTRTGWPHACR